MEQMYRGNPLLRVARPSFAVLVVIGVFLAMLSFISTPAAQAVSTAQVLVGATSVRVNQANNLGISLSGFTSAEQSASYQVTLKYVDSNNIEQSNGTLQATQGSTSLISGYSSYSASKLGFKGTYAAISTALATVTWTPASASSGLKLRIGLATAPASNQFYDANSGHYYEYISSGASWASAQSTALTKTLNGLNGYLAHITTAAENDFIANETSASNIWIGATDASSEGQWRWAGKSIAGESDFVFGTYSSSESGTNSATPTSTASGWAADSWYPNTGRVAGWASGEPNNWSASEDCAVTNWGSRGLWNDLSCSNSNAYLVEYGGGGGTLTTLSLTVDASMGASNALATWTSPGTPTTSATQAFGVSFNYDITGLIASDITNAGTAPSCVFTPSASAATSGTTVTVTASGCGVGTVQPKLTENSVSVTGGLVLPAATATAVTINFAGASVANSTVTLSSNAVLTSGTAVNVTATPVDTNGRRLGSGGTVTITSSLGTVSSVTDAGNGNYTATITPGATAGTSAIVVTAQGTTISSGLSLLIVGPATWSSPSTPTTAATQNFGLTFSDSISGLSAADFVNMGSATNCTFTPGVSSASSGVSVAVVATGCSTGTVQPKLLASSVILSSGLSLTASTATAVTINIGSATIAQSTVSLSRTSALITDPQNIVITITPLDAAGRYLGAGQTVTATSSLGTVGTVTDNGDGTYSVTVTTGTSAGTSNVVVSVNSTVISSGLQFAVVDPSVSQNVNSNNGASANRNSVASNTPSLPLINVAQSANITDSSKPITLTSGQLPTGVAGQSLVLTNGQTTASNQTVVNNQTIRTITPDGILLDVLTKSGNSAPIPLASDGSLLLQQGNSLAIQASGFAPQTTVKVWLFSEPKSIGIVSVNRDGTISSSLPITENLPIGKHTLQVTGLLPDGTTKSVMLSVTVEPQAQLITASQGDLNYAAIIVWIIAGLALASIAILLIVAGSRRRKQN